MILDAINRPERTAEMSKNCRCIAVNTFSLEVQAKRYLELYHRLVTANGRKTDALTFSMSQLDREALPFARNTDLVRYFPMQVIPMEKT